LNDDDPSNDGLGHEGTSWSSKTHFFNRLF
jgi:hypothetical protein